MGKDIKWEPNYEYLENETDPNRQIRRKRPKTPHTIKGQKLSKTKGELKAWYKRLIQALENASK